MIGHDVNLRDAAAALDLPAVRLLRLGRYLGLPPGEPCLPVDVVERAGAADDDDARYQIVLDWLINRPRTE
jgi:hypothetical protein